MSRVYRFFLRHTDLSLENNELFQFEEKAEPEIFFQLTKVLRVKSGDEIIVMASTGRPPFFEYRFKIEMVASKNISLRLFEKTANDRELTFDLELLLCMPNKPDKLEFILQKAVELGVVRITLLPSDFSQMKHQLKIDRLNKIVVEAAEQSERAVIPEIILEKKLLDFLPKKKLETHIAVAMERLSESKNGDSYDFKDGVKFFGIDPKISGENKKSLAILIGPEGGFSQQEKELITQLKLSTFSLGNRILRMETAAVLSLGIASLVL